MLWPLAFATNTAGIVVAFAAVVELAPVLATGVAVPLAPVALVATAEGDAAATVVAPAEGDAAAAGLADDGVVPEAGVAVLLAGAPQATARARAKPIAPNSLRRLRDRAFNSIGLGSSCCVPASPKTRE